MSVQAYRANHPHRVYDLTMACVFLCLFNFLTLHNPISYPASGVFLCPKTKKPSCFDTTGLVVVNHVNQLISIIDMTEGHLWVSNPGCYWALTLETKLGSPNASYKLCSVMPPWLVSTMRAFPLSANGIVWFYHSNLTLTNDFTLGDWSCASNTKFTT